MIEPLDGLPEGVIGLRASDEVTVDDYRDVMVPVLEEALARGGVRLLMSWMNTRRSAQVPSLQMRSSASGT